MMSKLTSNYTYHISIDGVPRYLQNLKEVQLHVQPKAARSALQPDITTFHGVNTISKP